MRRVSIEVDIPELPDLERGSAFDPEVLGREGFGSLAPWAGDLVAGGQMQVLCGRMPGFILRDHDVAIAGAEDSGVDHIEAGVIEEAGRCE